MKLCSQDDAIVGIESATMVEMCGNGNMLADSY